VSVRLSPLARGSSLPQKDANGQRTDEEANTFGKGLAMMAALYASAEGTCVLRLTNVPATPEGAEPPYNSTPIDGRGWCCFELFVTMITVIALPPQLRHPVRSAPPAAQVGTDAYHGGAAALTIPKLIDVQGGPVPSISAAPTPEEFAERLTTTRFIGN
jgi:hypothetical protein